MNKRKFDEKLYLYIKGELTDKEMSEMKKEIGKSDENRMLYENMKAFLQDSKQLLKEIKPAPLKNRKIINIREKTAPDRSKKFRKFIQPLAAAASFLLLLSIIYIFTKDNIPVIQEKTKKDISIGETITAAKEISKTTSHERGNNNLKNDKEKKSGANVIENMFAQNQTPLDSANVKRIVYLTDDPKVKIYWITD